MTITVQQTSNTNTFQFLVNRVNDLSNAMSTFAVTTNSNTAVGNAAVSNVFTANALVASSLKLSNSTANTTIPVPNTVQIANGNFYLNANGSWSPLIIPITSGNSSTTTTAGQEIDNYQMSIHGAVEFFIRVKDKNANSYHATKILTFHNNLFAFSTEYGSMYSNVSLGTFSVTSNSTHVQLNMVPTVANTEITLSRVNF